MFITKMAHEAEVAGWKAAADGWREKADGWKQVAGDYKQMVIELQAILAKVSTAHLQPVFDGEVEQPLSITQGDKAYVAALRAKQERT